MAICEIYPNLRKFCEENNIDFNSELDYICSSVHDDNHYNKDPKSDKTRNVNNKNSDKKHHPDRHNKNDTVTSSANPSAFGRTPNDIDLPQEHERSTSQQVIPSAPPIELLDEDIIRFIENCQNEEESEGPFLDETPAVDYTIRLDDTWVDDLQPDYDVTMDNIGADVLNNLNKADLKTSRDKLLNLVRQRSHPTGFNILSTQNRTKTAQQTDSNRQNRTQQKAATNIKLAAQPDSNTHTQEGPVNEAEKGVTPTSIEAAKMSPGSREYSAWMTWRKQVNRQLATIILLRQGGHVKLKQSDLSRRHLNKRSIDFVSNVVKSDNQTSLGGKPFLMYGIPRACLDVSQDR